MPYTAHDFQSGDILMAEDLNDMDEQIASLTETVESGGAGGGSYTINAGETGVEIVMNSQNSET
jgi:hypothetical protein